MQNAVIHFLRRRVQAGNNNTAGASSQQPIQPQSRQTYQTPQQQEVPEEITSSWRRYQQMRSDHWQSQAASDASAEIAAQAAAQIEAQAAAQASAQVHAEAQAAAEAVTVADFTTLRLL